MRLYEHDEKEFKTLGICSLNDYIECVIDEELNGSYELEMTYHIDSPAYKELRFRRIIYCKPNPYEAMQPFRIYSISTPINRVVTINAAHVSYDLSGYPVNPFISTSLQDTLVKLKENCVGECPFEFNSDLRDDWGVEITTPKSIRSVIGTEIFESYYPEIKYDKFRVDLLYLRGADNGVSIRYGKNMLDMTQEENNANVYTAVYPYWAKETSTTTSTTSTDTNQNEPILYSIGLLSDTHIDGDGDDEASSINDLHRAYDFFRQRGIKYICSAGDSTHDGELNDLQTFMKIKADNSDITLYAAGGNHDLNNASADNNNYTKYVEPNGRYFSKEINGDLYVFVGMVNYDYDNPFNSHEMEWLRQELSNNSDRRIFLFEHVFTAPTGNAGDVYQNHTLGNADGTTAKEFRDLMNEYENVIHFSGHSHLNFNLERFDDRGNASVQNGADRIHIPSCAKVRNNDGEYPDKNNTYTWYEGSQGCVMDVYESYIIVKGYDFRNGEQLTEYKLNTFTGKETGTETIETEKKLEIVTLTDRLVPTLGTYDYENILVLDLSSSFDNKPTEEELYNEAYSYVQLNNLGVPSVSITVDFIQITQSSDYAGYSNLDRVLLGDYVKVEFEEAGVSSQARCIKTSYNPRDDKYISIELGDHQSTLTDTIVNDRQFNRQQSGVAGTSYTNIDEIIQGITGNNGGHIRLNPVENPTELLIMDAYNLNDANVIWRWNNEGLSVSANGYGGPYVGVCQNGKLVIGSDTAYKFQASMIEGGVVESLNKTTTMNFNTGAINLSNILTFDGSTLSIRNPNGDLVMTNQKEYATVEYVDSIATGGTVDLSSYATKAELAGKSDTDHKHSEYATVEYVDSIATGGTVDLSAYATKAELAGKSDTNHTHDGLLNTTVFSADIDAGDSLDYITVINHGLGYRPAYISYQIDGNDDYADLTPKGLFDNNSMWDSGRMIGTANGGFVTVKGSPGVWGNVYTPLWKYYDGDTGIKENTVYTLVINILENTLERFVLASVNEEDMWNNDIFIDNGLTGELRFLVTSRATFQGGSYRLFRMFTDPSPRSGSIKFNVSILEGDHIINSSANSIPNILCDKDMLPCAKLNVTSTSTQFKISYKRKSQSVSRLAKVKILAYNQSL